MHKKKITKPKFGPVPVGIAGYTVSAATSKIGPERKLSKNVGSASDQKRSLRVLQVPRTTLLPGISDLNTDAEPDFRST